MRQPSRFRIRGVTLVELCVVLAVMLVLTGAGLPPLLSFLDRQRLEGAASELAADLLFTRTEALARNQPLRLSVYSEGGSSCYVVHSGERSDCRCEAGGRAACSGNAEPLKTVRWSADERLVLNANVASMRFEPGQGTTSPAGSLRISDPHERTISVVVNILGRVRSCTPQGSLPGYRAC